MALSVGTDNMRAGLNMQDPTPVSLRRCPSYLCHFPSPGTLITSEPFLEHCGAVNTVSMETSARHTLISGLEQLYFSDDE